MRKGYVDTDFGQIHYIEDGGAGPRLLLFHETALSAREFERTLPFLAQHCRAVAFDTPGFGMSDPPPEPLTMPQIAERLMAAIDSFGDEPCAIAGAHTGASIALELAANWLPDRTTHVAYTGLPLLSSQRIASIRGNADKREVLRRDGSHLMAGWDELRRHWGKAKNTDLEMLHWGMVEQLRAQRGASHWAHEAVFSHDTEAELNKVSWPTYFLVGEYDFLVESDKKAAQLVSGSRLKVLSGVGGRLPYVEPELYARELLDFIGVAG